MGRSYCFVPRCKSGLNSDRKYAKIDGKRVCSLFSPPQDFELWNKWQRAIPRADKVLSKNDRVCELHFQEEDIERFFVTKLFDGTVHKLERLKPILKKGAVPVIFPNLPAYLSKVQRKRKLPTSRNSHPKKYRDKSEDIVTEPLYQSRAGIYMEKYSKFVKEFEFSSIHSQSIKLPSNLWSITSTADFIIFAKWNKQYACERRIVIEKDLTVKVYMQTHAVDTAGMIKLTCLQDVSSLLLKVDSYVACAGVDDKLRSKHLTDEVS